jgi:hypothetical protein
MGRNWPAQDPAGLVAHGENREWGAEPAHGGSVAARRQSGEPAVRAGGGSDPRVGPVVGESI